MTGTGQPLGTTALWPAPTPAGPLNAIVEVPGSKSQTNRMLVLAALADSPSTIQGALRSRDTDLMIAALNQLGAVIVPGENSTTLKVRPIASNQLRPSRKHPPSFCAESGTDGAAEPPHPNPGLISINVGLAGTVMRFVPPVAATVSRPVRFDGDEGARVRPMKGLLDALASLGVQITYHGEPGFLPFTMQTTPPVQGGEVTVDASATSQFVSGLLLSAPRFADGLKLTTIGAVPSRPHLDMTVEALRERGVRVDDDADQGQWVVHPGPITGGLMRVEPDLSNAAPFLAAALVAGGSVSVPGWPSQTTQPGALVPSLLEMMGAKVEQDAGTMTVTASGYSHNAGTGNQPFIQGINVDLSAAGELAPTFAALAALAATPSRFTGIGHLRGHETDRLAALVTEINRLGGDARELPDGLEINTAPLHGGVWHTYDDHRMATAGAIIGLRVPGVRVENIETTAKTLPDFATMWAGLVGTQQEVTR